MSTCAFPGIKDTLHLPVSRKIFAAEAGPGSPHRRFALTLAGVASTVAAMSPEGAWPPDRGRVSEHSSFDASLRRHSHGPRQRACSPRNGGDHVPRGRGESKRWRPRDSNSGLLKQTRPLHAGDKAGPGASIRGGERDTPDCLNPTSMLVAWMVGSLPLPCAGMIGEMCRGPPRRNGGLRRGRCNESSPSEAGFCVGVRRGRA